MLEEAVRKLETAEKQAEKIIKEAKEQAEEILLKLAEEKEIVRQHLIDGAVREAEKIRLQAVALARKREEIFKEELEKKIAERKEAFLKKKDRIVAELLSWLEAEWL